MTEKIGDPVVCDLGGTGKLLRRTLTVRSAPPRFREQLREQLVSGLRRPPVPPSLPPRRAPGAP